MFAQMLTNHWAACTDNCFCDKKYPPISGQHGKTCPDFLSPFSTSSQASRHTQDGTEFTNVFFWTAESTQSKNLGQYFVYNIDFHFIFIKLKHWIILVALLRRCPFSPVAD